MKLTHEMCIESLSKLDTNTLRYLVNITMELEAAKQKHPDWPINANMKLKVSDAKKEAYKAMGSIADNKHLKEKFIHAAAIVSEESGELIRATLLYVEEDGRYYDMHREAIQTAAMALRFLTSSPEI